jgi:phage tail-like protein
MPQLTQGINALNSASTVNAQSGLSALDLGVAHRFTVTFSASPATGGGISGIVKSGLGKAVYPTGNWAKASGLKVQWKPVEHRPGDVVNGVWWYPGTTSYDQIKLARAADPTNTPNTYALLQTISSSNTPVSCTITMYTSSNQAVMTWEMDQAFPVGWEIDAFEASGSKVALEIMSIQHSGFMMDYQKLGVAGLGSNLSGLTGLAGSV